MIYEYEQKTYPLLVLITLVAQNVTKFDTKKQVRCVQFSLELIYILVWFSEHIWSNSCHNHVVLVTHATLVDSCKVFCAIQRLETMSNTTGWLVFNGTSNTDRLRHVHQVKMMTKSYN